MKNGLCLMQQPEDGVTPLLTAINNAKNSIDIVIFRFDHPEIEKALAGAVRRGVTVHALIAQVNSSGEESLRRLEARLLGDGVIVSRSGGDFSRYHAKLLVTDRSELYLLAFNYTKLDINRSRSFGMVVKDAKMVREALRLIDADTKRQPYESELDSFVVSPENARKQLSEFIEGATEELLIYDPKISDPAILRLLEERLAANVSVRVIGSVSPAAAGLPARRLRSPRLHTRAIIRDRKMAFIGSQSLREMELDRRREAGMIFENAAAIARMMKTFEEDWEVSKPLNGEETAKAEAPPVSKLAKRVAKAVSKDLPPVAPMLEGTIKELGVEAADFDLDADLVEEAVRDAVKDAVQEALEDVVAQARRDEAAR